MGCGKTTIGKVLAKEIKYDFIDCDEYLESRFDITIKECFDISEKYFRDLETDCVKEISEYKNKVISTGGGIVLKKENIELLKDDIIVFINRPLDNILSDIELDTRPLVKNGGKEAVIQIYNSRLNLYKQYCHYEVANDKSIEMIVNEIKNLM